MRLAPNTLICVFIFSKFSQILFLIVHFVLAANLQVTIRKDISIMKP